MESHSYNSDTSITISFQLIFVISCFQLKHAYFQQNGKVFLQLLGLPQGGPGSLAFSMIVCIYYEFRFTCIYDHLSFISFFRYFDDLRAVVVYIRYFHKNTCCRSSSSTSAQNLPPLHEISPGRSIKEYFQIF